MGLEGRGTLVLNVGPRRGPAGMMAVAPGLAALALGLLSCRLFEPLLVCDLE